MMPSSFKPVTLAELQILKNLGCEVRKVSEEEAKNKQVNNMMFSTPTTAFQNSREANTGKTSLADDSSPNDQDTTHRKKKPKNGPNLSMTLFKDNVNGEAITSSTTTEQTKTKGKRKKQAKENSSNSFGFQFENIRGPEELKETCELILQKEIRRVKTTFKKNVEDLVLLHAGFLGFIKWVIFNSK